MDLPQIGAHCGVSSCNVLDFLPITCKCSRQFCSEHIIPDHHDCSTFRAATIDSLSTSVEPIQRCAIDGCNKPSLRIFNGNMDETCSLCHKSFCPDHRFPELHNCFAIVERKSDNKTTKNVSVRKSSPVIGRNPKPPSDPAKLVQWQKVELMKMRHRAIPGDPKDRNATIPPDQRYHVKIVIDNAEKIFWFRKTVITGKALDLLASQLEVTIPSNTSLQLARVGSDKNDVIILRCDKFLSEQVEDGCALDIQLQANGRR